MSAVALALPALLVAVTVRVKLVVDPTAGAVRVSWEEVPELRKPAGLLLSE
jgi:hypothetical protein